MAFISYLALAFGVLMISEIGSSNPEPPPNAVRFVGVGYDILEGNPEGGSIGTGGVDPGLKATRKIFKLTYDDNRVTNDRKYQVPDEVVFVPRGSCVETSTNDVFHGTKSYQKKLSVDVSVSGNGATTFANFEFSLSTRYKQVREGTDISKYVYFEKRNVCNKGKARYRKELAGSRSYPLGDGFVVDACKLPSTYDKVRYMNFIKNWGTHTVTVVTVGTKVVERSREKQDEFIRLARDEVGASVTAGASSVGGTYGASLAVDVDTFKQEMSSEMKFGRDTYKFHSGTDDFQEPIGLKMMEIHEVFDNRYWKLIDEYVNDNGNICSQDWFNGIAKIKENVETALKSYAVWRKAVISHDPLIKIPITWPLGTYGLPKPSDGCPSGWATGRRHHYTENDYFADDNKWSATNHFSAHLNEHDLRQEFCMKTVKKADENNWSWPKGKYCIFKKGKICPEGLLEGYLYWDDEDSETNNAVQGEMPEGSYGSNTKIFYCCATTGFTSNPIYLPVEKPFYLMKYNHQCQEVHGMVYSQEYIEWDNENGGWFYSPESSQSGTHPYKGVLENNNIKIEYCYYKRI